MNPFAPPGAKELSIRARPSMKRLIEKVTLFLFLGAIINIAVAWALAMLVDVTFTPMRQVNDGTQFATSWRRMGAERWTLQYVPNTGHTFDEPPIDYYKPAWCTADSLAQPSWDVSRHPALDQCDMVAFDARGWPCLALQGQVGSTIVRTVNAGTTDDAAAIRLNRPAPLLFFWVRDIRFLPTRPVWPGFAINTLFYAAILSLLFAAPGFVRRRRRIKRGLCPACAYPIGASETCTECGKPVPTKCVEPT
ncbi:MAG: hypothetical protein L0Y42_01395 [Phycisphaerales bacterium]|nr:hypothetical protein [Phycisphaerales bacterium]